MRKLFSKSLLILGMASVVFSGCSTKQATSEEIYISQELEDAPQWVMKPKVEGYISEMGSATRNAGDDFNFQREEAISEARSNMVKQIEIKVNTMFQSFKETTGSGEDSTFDNSSKTVSKQIATGVLKGTIVKETWMSKSGTLYVLMVIDTSSIENAMGKAIKSSFNNDNALHQKFLASKAQGELTEELEKLNKKE